MSTYFKYPQKVWRLIYTTNTIEEVNRQLRKVTKSKSVFPTDDSLLKRLQKVDWSEARLKLDLCPDGDLLR